MKRRISLVALSIAVVFVLGAGAASAGVSKAADGIEFTYDGPDAGSVHLAGEFNDWNMNATPLTMDEDGIWRVVVDLAPGTYEYKFVVNGSEWIADPENATVVGEYGNSGITIDEDGEPVVAAPPAPISNTRVNSQVSINGWYRATYDTQSDVPSDERWRLTRPAHEIYMSVNPTIGSNVAGSATMRMSTGSGDIKEVTAEIYSGRLELDGDDFSITGFYNEELVQFDSPGEFVGHIDLLGTIPEEHIPFGRGAQGLIATKSYKKAAAALVYANIYEYDLMNDPTDPDEYDNTDTDLLAARLKVPVGPVFLGGTFASWRDGWWIDWTSETNYSPHLQAFIDSTGSESNWFELSNSDRWMGVDAAVYDVGRMFDVKAEYAAYNYESVWDMGNKEKIEGADKSNGAIDVPVGDTDGWLATGVIEGSPFQPFNLKLRFDSGKFSAMSDDEEYVAYGAPLWARGVLPMHALLANPKRTYTEVRFDGSPLVASVYDPLPETDLWGLELDAGFSLGIFELGLEYDTHSYDIAFGAALKEALGFDEWTGDISRLAGRGRADVMPDRLWVEIEGERMSFDEPDGKKLLAPLEGDSYETLQLYESREAILRGGWSINEDWGIIADIRHIKYYGVQNQSTVTDTLGNETTTYEYDDESFLAPHLALVYSPRKNVKVQIGYGVDPLNYVDTPVEGRGNGRERWRERYLWDHSDHDIDEAEQALEDARTIGVMAVIAF